LKAYLNLLTLSLVIGPTGTSNGSFGVAWVALFPFSSKEFYIE